MKIKIADIPIEIHTLYDALSRDCSDYLTDDDPVFTVKITEEDIAEEEKKSILESAYEGLPCPHYFEKELEKTAVYRKIAMKLPEYDAVVFHGSAVAVGETAFLFTARSGTGKTTHTKLWLENINNCYVVNGDKPILRVIDGTPYVCGTPWMGKEKYGCNKIVRLDSIAFLQRAEENSITQVGFSKILPQFISQTYRPPNSPMLAKTIKIIEMIGKKVSLYELFCNMEKDAALVSYEGMTNDKF